MTSRSSLRTRILTGFLGYIALLSVAVSVQGLLVNEYAERLVWQTMLRSELDHYLERQRLDPQYHWIDTRATRLFDSREGQARVPSALRSLPPGLHDDIEIDGRESVVLVRDIDGSRLFLLLNLTEFEARERDMALTVVGAAITMVVLLGLLIIWSVNRLLEPLTALAVDIGLLQPSDAGRSKVNKLDIPEGFSTELFVIATAVNSYLDRNARFVERERAFIDTASHELRTPLAVILGATELGIAQADDPSATRKQFARIASTAREVEDLISLLLLLAKDPAKIAAASEPIALEKLLPEIVENHRYLARGKDLAFDLASLPTVEIYAPLPIVQSAISNLLRNAIENSDRGDIKIRLGMDATIVIEDPGHGMTPEEISAIYAGIARGGGERGGGGIGLDLISRLCEHLGWGLSIQSDSGRGTITALHLRSR